MDHSTPRQQRVDGSFDRDGLSTSLRMPFADSLVDTLVLGSPLIIEFLKSFELVLHHLQLYAAAYVSKHSPHNQTNRRSRAAYNRITEEEEIQE